jgi:hypothetical protein
VIAYMDNYRGEGGSFALVFSTNDTNCYMVNGTIVTIEEIPMEAFRQLWTGYVLAPPHSVPSPSQEAKYLSCGMGVVVLAGYVWWRARPALALRAASARSEAA